MSPLLPEEIDSLDVPVEPKLLASTTSTSTTETVQVTLTRSDVATVLEPPKATSWSVRPSRRARRTCNPLRNVVDYLRPSPHHGDDKPLLSLALGDPTVFGNIPLPEVLRDDIVRNLHAGSCNGYAASTGLPQAKAALASAYSLPGIQLTEEDIIIASGASGALEIVFSGLLNEGDTILIPRPGFSLYQVITQSIGATALQYDLLPEQGWDIDLVHLESLIDESTKAILINNPSNPCGTVLSRENLLGVLEIAERHRLPVIADEIYADLTFKSATFYPLASLTSIVPVLTIGGMAKQFAVPGWRVGWIIVYDNGGVLNTGDVSIRQGLRNLTQLTLGANTLIQSSLPAMFPPMDTAEAKVLRAYTDRYVHILETNAAYVVERLKPIAGLDVVVPQAAMYALIKINTQLLRQSDVLDDVDFCSKLLYEENVVVLPGACFGASGCFRVVLAPPLPVLKQAFDRIEAFCARHTSVATTVNGA